MQFEGLSFTPDCLSYAIAQSLNLSLILPASSNSDSESSWNILD